MGNRFHHPLFANVMFSFKVCKPRSVLLVPLLFWKICCPHFQRTHKEQHRFSKAQATGESNPSGCKEHCHLSATRVHYREVDSRGGGKAATVSFPTSPRRVLRGPSTPAGRKGEGRGCGLNCRDSWSSGRRCWEKETLTWQTRQA